MDKSIVASHVPADRTTFDDEQFFDAPPRRRRPCDVVAPQEFSESLEAAMWVTEWVNRLVVMAFSPVT
jgi:hypothetical protein